MTINTKKLIIKENKIFCDRTTVCDLFSCTPNYATELASKDILVSESRKYELIQSIRNYIKYMKARIPQNTHISAASGQGADLHEEKARLTKAQADKAEMEVAELSGDLVRSDTVLSEWQGMLMDIKGKLLSIPSKAATLAADETSPVVIQGIIDSFIREALQELSEYGTTRRYQSDPDEWDVGSEATT